MLKVVQRYDYQRHQVPIVLLITIPPRSQTYLLGPSRHSWYSASYMMVKELAVGLQEFSVATLVVAKTLGSSSVFGCSVSLR